MNIKTIGIIFIVILIIFVLLYYGYKYFKKLTIKTTETIENIKNTDYNNIQLKPYFEVNIGNIFEGKIIFELCIRNP
jgi:hypothetical protein